MPRRLRRNRCISCEEAGDCGKESVTFVEYVRRRRMREIGRRDIFFHGVYRVKKIVSAKAD